MEPKQATVLNRRKRKKTGITSRNELRRPTMTLGMQSRMRERQMRKRRQEGSRLRASDVESGMGGYMTGGQAKIAAKAPPPNKIDAKDFAVLRAEKAKGRGQGLQDEKMKPGKVMKAVTGRAIAGPQQQGLTPEKAKKAKEKILMDRFKKKRKEQSDKPKTPLGGKIKKPKPGSYEYQQQQTQNTRPSQILPKKKMGGVMKAKMGKAVDYKKFLDGLKKATNEVNYNRAVMKRKAMEKAKDIGGFAKRAAKASKYGKIALGVAGIGLAAKEYLKTRKRKKKEEIAVRTLKEDMAVQKLKEGLPKKMGGGMMQRPMMGYKSGTMVKAKGCKLGRSKPTKLY